MAGINDTDIRLTGDWQLTRASTGDAPVCTGYDCFLQDIQLEAVSLPGELFYDSNWGWGLSEFLQSEDEALTRLEIEQRIKGKLGRRKEIDVTSIQVEFKSQQDVLYVLVRFRFVTAAEEQRLALSLSRIDVEVKRID